MVKPPASAMPEANLAEALVAHCARILPGDEQPDLQAITPTVIVLARDLRGAALLQQAIRGVNDAGTILLVKTVIQRVAADLELRQAGKSRGSIVALGQAGCVTGIGAAVLAMAIGTLTLGPGLILLGGLAVGAIGTTELRAHQDRGQAVVRRDLALVLNLLEVFNSK